MSLTPDSPAPVELWKPNKSNTSTPNYTPCGYLVKNTKCPNPGCDYSHEHWRVRSWQNKHAHKPCRWGSSCPHFMQGNCLYYHPPQHHAQSEPVDRHKIIKEDLGQLVERLDVNSLVAEQDVGICDKGDLASFNKIADDEIAVPGCPPRFHPITEPLSVTLDWHNPTLQPSFAKYTHTFEPLLRSLEATDPTFDIFSTADIVSNASNLRKLFHLFSNKKKLTERFDLEWRQDTLFLSKWTGDPSLGSSLGHGTGFEKETCRYADDDHEVLRSSSSHHRVVWYSFAGLDCIIQSEVDGYYCECDHPRCSFPLVPPPARKTQAKQQKPLDIRTVKNKPRREHRRKFSSSSSSSTLSTSSTASLARSPPNWNHSTSSLSSTSTRTKPNNISSKSTTQFSRFSTLLSLDDPGDTPEFISSSSYGSYSSSISSNSTTSNMNIHHPHTYPSMSQQAHVTSTTSTLKVHNLPGRNIPSPCLIEVKTHKTNNKPMFDPEAQLYFCRRTKLLVAQHKNGVFRPPVLPLPLPSPRDEQEEHQVHDEEWPSNDENRSNSGVEDKTDDLVKWERENQPILGKVAAFLRLLTDKMRERAMMPGIETISGKMHQVGIVQGMSVVIEGDGKGKVKAGLYLRRKDGDGEHVKSLLPDGV